VNLAEVKDGWLRYLMSSLFKSRQPCAEVQEHLDRRFETCMSCPHMTVKKYFSKREWRTCGKCGCAFPAMIFAYEKRCPVGLWEVIPKHVRALDDKEKSQA